MSVIQFQPTAFFGGKVIGTVAVLVAMRAAILVGAYLGVWPWVWDLFTGLFSADARQNFSLDASAGA